MKKGPLKEIEKECIQQIKDKFTIDEIASFLNRSSSTIQKFIDTIVAPERNKLSQFKIAGNESGSLVEGVIVINKNTSDSNASKNTNNNRKIANDIYIINPNKK